MIRLALLGLTIAMALAAGPVSAETLPADSTYYIRDYAEIASPAGAEPWWGMTFDLIVKLGLVVGLIYLTMWALRRYVLVGQTRGAAGPSGRLEVIDTTVLAPGRTIYLVEVADRVLVLGATGTALATLAEIREPDAVALLKRTPEPAADAPPSFAAQLRALADRLPHGSAFESTDAPPAAASATAFLADKIGELRSLASNYRRPAADGSGAPP